MRKPSGENEVIIVIMACDFHMRMGFKLYLSPVPKAKTGITSQMIWIVMLALFSVCFMSVARSRAQSALPDDLKVKFNAAVEAHKAGHLEAAADGYRLVLQASPNFAPALLNLGLIEFALHHPDHALPLLTRAKTLDPSSQPAWAFAGLSSLQLRDLPAAEQSLEKAVSLQPDDEKALLFLGQTYNAMGKYLEAEDVLQKAEALDARDTEVMYALSQAYMHLAVDTSARLRETDPHSPRVYQLAGQMFAENQNLKAAISEFRELVRRYPTLAGAHALLGHAYEGTGNSNDALAAYEQEISIDPFNADMYASAGKLLLDSKDNAKGVRYLKRALELDPASEVAEVAYGKYLIQQKQTGEALALLKRAAEINGQNKNVHFLLAQAYAQAGKMQEAQQERALFEKIGKEEQMRKELGPSAFIDADVHSENK